MSHYLINIVCNYYVSVKNNTYLKGGEVVNSTSKVIATHETEFEPQCHIN